MRKKTYPPNLVFTCLLTKHIDPLHTQERWEPDPLMLRVLTLSLERHGVDYVVFHDEVKTDDPHFVKTKWARGIKNPFIQRWATYRKFLIDHPEVEKIWCVDGTDVELGKRQDNPFDIMQPNTLYIGWEPHVLGIEWMREHHEASRSWIDAHADRLLLNAGVVGGNRNVMLAFIDQLFEFYEEDTELGLADDFDMGLVNKVAYTMNHVTGPRITSLFRAWDRDNPHAVFIHK